MEEDMRCRNQIARVILNEYARVVGVMRQECQAKEVEWKDVCGGDCHPMEEEMVEKFIQQEDLRKRSILIDLKVIESIKLSFIEKLKFVKVMILQNMTNASGISDESMAITLAEPNGTKTPSPASTSGDASETPWRVKTETPVKSLKRHRKIEVTENLTPMGVLPGTKGEGLPYAPEGFPNPEDKWIWKVGKRMNSSGYMTDRYLFLPPTLQEGTRKTIFSSKQALEKYMRRRFPEVDLESFFASFIWSVPGAYMLNGNGSEEMIDSSVKRARKSEIIVHSTPPVKRTCNAGNMKCFLETGKGKFSKPMDCDICCVESGFCRECSCILCGKCVDHDLEEYYFIQCQEKLSDEFTCGHVAHLECAIICQTGGVVRSIGLDVEYYCRRCDKKTDLLKHVLGLITTPGSGKLRSDVENSLNLALRLIQGTQQTRCRSLENLIQSALKKLQSGMELQDIFGDAEDNSGKVNADIGYNVKDNTPLKPTNISPIFLSKSGCNGDILREILHQ
ncbi:hypothetical protein KI387_011900, partial [Taxus chinensis]